MKIINLKITNFKSIEHLELSNFKRINLFIGRPNVGKSNIIEALSLFNISYFKMLSQLSSLIRFENYEELFYDGNTDKPISVIINNQEHCQVARDYYENGLKMIINDNVIFKKTDSNTVIRLHGGDVGIKTNIKRYIFEPNKKHGKSNFSYLKPPFGENLLEVIERFPVLKKEITDLFTQYNLKIVFDRASNSLKIMKERGDDIFLLPYSSIADTLQRVILYKTAIASNQNSCILLEEPEAHAFPPYISQITSEIVASETNQFFITTHSPIIMNDFLENAKEDLAIFIIDYKNNQTVVRQLSEAEIFEVHKYGIDLFFNQEAYL